LIILWFEVYFITAANDGIVLADDDGALCEYSKVAPGKFIEKVTEGVVIFVLLGHVLYGEL
jgi:hypothetical protein